MILIFQDTINQVVFTLTEKKRTDTDVYLLVFTNETSNVSFSCVVTDNSVSQYRYNRFCLKHRFGAVDPMAGEVNMTLEGFYTYEVYENPDSVLDPAGLNLCEFGKMKCIGTATAIKAFTPTDITKKVFNAKDYEI